MTVYCFHNIADSPKNEWAITPNIINTDVFKPGDEIHFDDAREGVFKYGFEIFKKLLGKVPMTIFVVTEWIEGNVQEHEQYSNFMTWNQIKEMADAGFEIGSHSLSHEDMTTLTDDEVNNELKNSQKIIEEKLGIVPDKFSYPYGKYDQRIISFTRKYYKIAYGIHEPDVKTRYNLPRKLVVSK